MHLFMYLFLYLNQASNLKTHNDIWLTELKLTDVQGTTFYDIQQFTIYL